MVEQRIDQGTIQIARRRVHHQPRRLVHHDEVLVLISDDQRNVLRHVVRGRGQRNRDLERVARRHPLRRVAGEQPLARDVAGRNQHLQPLARQRRRGIGKRAVEPPAVRPLRDARLNDGNPPVHDVNMGCEVVFRKGVLTQIRARAAASTHEVCGLLLGHGSQVTEAVHCSNVAADPATTFEIDPAQLIAALREARAGGPQVVGCYHSHPSGTAQPSPRDAAEAAANGWLWLIVAGGKSALFRAVAGGDIHGRFVPQPHAVYSELEQ